MGPQGNLKQDEVWHLFFILYLFYFKSDTCPTQNRHANHSRHDCLSLFLLSWKPKTQKWLFQSFCHFGLQEPLRSPGQAIIHVRQFSLRMRLSLGAELASLPKKWGILWTTLKHCKQWSRRPHFSARLHNYEYLFPLCPILSPFNYKDQVSTLNMGTSLVKPFFCFPQSITLNKSLCPTIICLFSWHIVTCGWAWPAIQVDTFALNSLNC